MQLVCVLKEDEVKKLNEKITCLYGETVPTDILISLKAQKESYFCCTTCIALKQEVVKYKSPNKAYNNRTIYNVIDNN